MKQSSNTKEQIIDQAYKLMAQRGYNGFSYRDISEPLGVKNAAIHYHFPSKTDLVRALIDENHQVLKKSTSEFMAYGGPALPQLEGLFLFTQKQCECGRPICLVGALAVDYEDLPDDVKAANDSFMKDSIAWLTRVLEIGLEQAEFSFRGEPRQKAMAILAAIQGGRQLARIHGEDYLGNMFNQIRTDLGVNS
jgi:TetR/AcrR family transcriptional repressor of nem operon